MSEHDPIKDVYIPAVIEGLKDSFGLGHYAAAVEALRDERDALAAALAALPQTLTDPENQPSQWGTVPVADYNALSAELATLRAKLPALLERLADVAGDCSVCPLDENDEDEDGCDCENHGLAGSPCLIAARSARAWAARLQE